MKKTSHFLCGLALCGVSNMAQAADLAPFRATYAFQPLRIDQAARATPLDGEIAYEVKGSACAGYAIASRFTSRFADPKSGTRTVELDSTTSETPDGLGFDVIESQLVNRQDQGADHINANRPAPDQLANVQQSGSKKASFTLPAGVLFPSQHQQKLLAAAASGQKRDTSLVYDGSDGDKLFRIITFIGKKRDPGTYAPDANEASLASLKSMASWTFDLGYYPVAIEEADAPEFQAAFNMYENGISTDITFDYGTYALQGRINWLEPLAPDPCPKPLSSEIAKPQ